MVRPDCHLLVYEFMKNGSLQGILNDVSQGRRELEWLARHRISRGIVSGLEYLHMYHRPRIIHRDIKPGNALIDDDMEDRISDFGLAKVLPDGHTQIRASNTDFGVAETLTFSDECDICSFGVLLAVLMMGKLPSDDFFQHTEEMSLVKWMRNVMNSANPNRAIDSKLLGNGYEEQMLLVLKIAYFCTMDDPKQRPNSRVVRCMLSQIQH
ncbi:leucine-rich repeat receptor-like serine/threonine/tyrosine-protein kinase SOBIR1 [Citrus sinensis]|nr:leucine-rich repeat receptor-like serine/threonine/tyrosine-protein kinase SOBIR1 [Citrus sinensis]